MAAISSLLMVILSFISVTLAQDCRLKRLARFNVTFEGLWKRSVFPKQYPLWRPPAQWGKVVGKSITLLLLV